jgi:hypothetical protein
MLCSVIVVAEFSSFGEGLGRFWLKVLAKWTMLAILTWVGLSLVGLRSGDPDERFPHETKRQEPDVVRMFKSSGRSMRLYLYDLEDFNLLDSEWRLTRQDRSSINSGIVVVITAQA